MGTRGEGGLSFPRDGAFGWQRSGGASDTERGILGDGSTCSKCTETGKCLPGTQGFRCLSWGGVLGGPGPGHGDSGGYSEGDEPRSKSAGNCNGSGWLSLEAEPRYSGFPKLGLCHLG